MPYACSPNCLPFVMLRIYIHGMQELGGEVVAGLEY